MSRKSIILLGIFILAAAFLPGYTKYQELKEKNRQLVDDVSELRQQNADLTRQAEKLENDPFYVERTARNKMGLGKNGEIRYKVIEDEAADESEKRAK